MLALKHGGDGEMDSGDRIDREILARLGLDGRTLRNAANGAFLPWLPRLLREFKPDASDMVALAAYCVLNQSVGLTRAQAGNVAAALRGGLDHERQARVWYVSYDVDAKRWRVATTRPPDGAGFVALDLDKLKARLTALRSLVEEELAEEQPE
jgi:hypothetical protein